MPHPLRKHWIPAILLGLSLLPGAASAAGEKKLYRWTDAEGRVHYGDKIPPQDAKQGKAAINKQGVVTKVVPRELTQSERVAADAAAKAAQDAADAHARLVAADRYLVQAYASVADIQAARTERLAAIDSRIALVGKAVVDTEATLGKLRKRAAEPGVAPQIVSFERALIENLQANAKLRDERAATVSKFASDIDRYKRLKAGTLQPGG